MVKTFGIVCIFSLLMLLFAISESSSAEKLILVGAKDTKESFHGRWLTLIYNEVFQRMGLNWEYQAHSSARSSELSDSGIADGEINRVSGYNTTHPNLLRVEESHFPTRVVAYTTLSDIRLTGWNSLKNTHYNVEYRRGTKIVKDGLDNTVPQSNLSSVLTAQQGLKKLIAGRTDIYIDVESLIEDELFRLEQLKLDVSIVYNAGLMAEDSLHMFLHKSRADLIPAVSKILKSMKQENLIEQYREMALQQ